MDRQLDVGLVEGPVPEEDDLTVEPFWSDELVLVVPAGHPWTKKEEITFDDLLSARFITREKGSGTRRVMELALARGGFDPCQLNIVMELNSTQAIKEAVGSGLGVTIISCLTVQEECRDNRLAMLRLSGCQLARPLNIITNTFSSLTPEEQWYLDQIRSRERIESLMPTPLLP